MLYLRKLRHILRSRFLFKILVLLVILLDIIFTKCYHFKSKYKESDTTFIGIVTDFEVKDNKLVIELTAKEKSMINYDYNKLIIYSLFLVEIISVILLKIIFNSLYFSINNLLIIYLFIYLWPHLPHMEVPGPRVASELQQCLTRH